MIGSPISRAQLRRAIAGLLAWFGRSRRTLPWRREPRDPYHVWLSEAMLQQTQVATVVPYFERWITRFPSVSALAAAPVDDVLKLWEGLGYYARARNLHRAARIVDETLHGQLPDTLEGLLALPGIGRYTAGAIASLAFNRDAPALDGNVKRVLSRLFAIGADWRSRAWPVGLGVPPGTVKTLDDLLWAIDEALLPRGKAGAYNEAMMELGATVCAPRAPDCPICPLRAICAGFASGQPERFPVRVKKERPPERTALTAVLVDPRGRMLLGQRNPSGLLGGLWEFVSSEAAPAPEFDATLAADALSAVLAQRTGLTVEIGPDAFLGAVRHTFTNFRLVRHIAVIRLRRMPGPLKGDPGYQRLTWADRPEIGALALTGSDHKVLSLLTAGQTRSHPPPAQTESPPRSPGPPRREKSGQSAAR